MFARLKSWLRRKDPSEAGSVEPVKPAPAPEREVEVGSDGMRETIEQIVIAFILAFVFRTFAAEPFVIPTGSMAPTLFGRHKEFECIECGFQNVIGASDEIPKESTLLNPRARIESAACQNCRAINYVRDELAHTGDRILVTKYPYELGEPERFDVFVFKYPEEPITNFIKRLIGLPGEYIRILNGDVYRRLPTGEFEILRKEPHTQRAIQIPVYDDDFPPQRLLEKGWPERWAAMSYTGVAGLDGWNDSTDGFEQDAEARTFQLNTSSPEWQWLRYRNYESGSEEWRALDRGDPFTIQARMIGDFCGYNATLVNELYIAVADDGYKIIEGIERIDATVEQIVAQATRGPDSRKTQVLIQREAAGAQSDVADLERALLAAGLTSEQVTPVGPSPGPSPGIDWGLFWVGDLTVNFTLDVESVEQNGALLLELVEGVYHYRCEVDLSTGQARLYSINVQNDSEEELALGESETDLSGTGSHSVSFANVDSRICLWIDDDLIEFGEAASYDTNELTGNDFPTNADLTPVGIAVRGATAEVSHLLLERDIYYRSDGYMEDRSQQHGVKMAERELSRLMARPFEWGNAYDEFRRDGLLGILDIQVGPRHYLALGDNSPRSGDSRYWADEDRTVARELLVGKAFWVYWPHGVPFLNNGRGYSIWNHRQRDANGNIVVTEDYPKYTAPFFPNFWRMRLIH
jgi:signal peptidase I